MKVIAEHNERIVKIIFALVYPHYITKVENKVRTQKELYQVMGWSIGFDEGKL